MGDGLREIGEDLRDGRPVTPEDIFRATKPLMRDLAPIFDRMRVKEQSHRIDTMTGELARKYDLNEAQQESLKAMVRAAGGGGGEAHGATWSGRTAPRLEDLARAARDVRPDEGLETFMAGTLSGDKLAAFKTERMAERAERVQQEADMKVQRLDSIVGLDDTQRDQVFGIMARGSRDYDPAMMLEGHRRRHRRNTRPATASRRCSSVLRPEQRAGLRGDAAEAPRGSGEGNGGDRPDAAAGVGPAR